MVNKGGREAARAGAWRVTKFFFRVLCVARRSFLCVYGVLDDEGHGVMFVLTWRGGRAGGRLFAGGGGGLGGVRRGCGAVAVSDLHHTPWSIPEENARETDLAPVRHDDQDTPHAGTAVRRPSAPHGPYYTSSPPTTIPSSPPPPRTSGCYSPPGVTQYLQVTPCS